MVLMIFKSNLGGLFGLWIMYIYFLSSVLRLDVILFYKWNLKVLNMPRMRQKSFKVFQNYKQLDSLALWYEAFNKNVDLHAVAVLAQLPVQLYCGPHSELIWLQ